MFTTSKQKISHNCQKVDFSHYTSRSIEFVQEVIGKKNTVTPSSGQTQVLVLGIRCYIML